MFIDIIFILTIVMLLYFISYTMLTHISSTKQLSLDRNKLLTEIRDLLIVDERVKNSILNNITIIGALFKKKLDSIDMNLSNTYDMIDDNIREQRNK